MLCRKRSRVVLTAHKEQNLSKSSSVVASEQLRYTAETVKVKVTHRKCSNMFMNLLFIICTIDFPTRSSIHSFQSWGGKKSTTALTWSILLPLPLEKKNVFTPLLRTNGEHVEDFSSAAKPQLPYEWINYSISESDVVSTITFKSGNV